MKTLVSLDFAEAYRSACLGLEEMACSPEALAMHKAMWIVDANNVVGIKCYHSGIIRFFAAKNNLVNLASSSWEVAMAIYAFSGGPYKGLLERNYFCTRMEVGALFRREVLEQEQKEWLRLKGINIP